ncbi:2,4'-dihydroxyacetophenone dioxygenase family protein [Sporichthya polymorpha]|uniref:2,4'-dihydroxyacetophenone dioxygenase family protein n=1 Tax=Sporichthya polymorpha TaxID=35751 RepID=UPI000369CA48|nr:2,4'-dihydroxyacetophenone dioxygenase family protein [Sporichthya polymorpha]
MTTTLTAPGLTTTGAGAPLPVVAVPQGDLLWIDESATPWLVAAMGPGLDIKPLRIDLERNEWVLLLRAAPGVGLPIHYHTGPAEVFTLSGRWYYREYPNSPQVAGSYLYEPSGSVHQFHTPADNTEDTVALIRVAGANVNFNDDGTFHSVLDAVALRYLAGLLAEAQGVESRWIEGAETGFTSHPAAFTS